MKISVVITAFNEEKKIEDCLKSVEGWAEEIIVVDNSSTDKTFDIAKKYTDKVYSQVNNPQDIDIQKNFGFEKATKDWILSLDADERVTQELCREIEALEEKENVNGYEIPRRNIIFGKWIEHSIWWPDYQLRLFKKGKGKYIERTVHNPLVVEGKTQKLINPLVHENYQTISQYLYKMDKIYTENEANKIVLSGKTFNKLDAIKMPAHDFLKTFFLQQGYKDGLHGLVLSMLQAFYSLIVFAKVWEKQGFKEENSASFLNDVWKEFGRISNEFYYWFLTESLNKQKNIIKKTLLKVKRRKTIKKI